METLSLSLSRIYLFHFPAARFNGKERSPGIVFPLFISFSNWQRSATRTKKNRFEPYGEYVRIATTTTTTRIRFRVRAGGFYREAIVLAFLFLFRGATNGPPLKREENLKKKSRRGARCLKHSRTVDRGHDRVYERGEEAEGEGGGGKRGKGEERSIALETLSRRKGRGSR